MTDPVDLAFVAAIGGAVVGMFLRIEHRLTKVETTVLDIKEHIDKCPPPSEGPTK